MDSVVKHAQYLHRTLMATSARVSKDTLYIRTGDPAELMVRDPWRMYIIHVHKHSVWIYTCMFRANGKGVRTVVCRLKYSFCRDSIVMYYIHYIVLYISTLFEFTMYQYIWTPHSTSIL